jgi:hypothetical protein
MSAITKEQLEKVKDARQLALVTSENVKAGKEIWQIENRHWDDYRRALAGCGEELIAAAEEGLKANAALRSGMDGAGNYSGVHENACILISQRDNARSEADTLRARVKESLGALEHLVGLLEPLEQAGTLNIPGLATLNGARAAISKAKGEAL